MSTYHPHCNQHKCYHDGGIHRANLATAAVAPTPLTVYMVQYEGSKNHRIKPRDVRGYSWEEQMEDHIREHDANDEWKRVRPWVFLGLAGLIGYLYLAKTYVLPVLDAMMRF